MKGNSMYIPDPIELMDARIDRAIDRVEEVGEGCCMACGKKVDYELIQATADPASWAVCYDCLDPETQKAYNEAMEK